jgi:hypothetical protein
MIGVMKTQLLSLVALLALGIGSSLAAENDKPHEKAAPAVAAAEPGPENGGLRMRLVVTPNPKAGAEGYDVRLDLLNVSDHAIWLKANWSHDTDKGDLKDYLEAATSIESDPPIAPWVGQVQGGYRKWPQPEQELKAGESLSIHWQTEGRQLKNRVTDPNAVQNPQFPSSGLYSVHSTLAVRTDQRTVRLRSNEQLVPVGGSREQPKHTFGRLSDVDAAAKTATLGLGALHKVEVGDKFRIRSGMGDFWRLTITTVDREWSTGQLEPEPVPFDPSKIATRPPEPHMAATLIP